LIPLTSITYIFIFLPQNNVSLLYFLGPSLLRINVNSQLMGWFVYFLKKFDEKNAVPSGN
jgi:hypothetical protein